MGEGVNANNFLQTRVHNPCDLKKQFLITFLLTIKDKISVFPAKEGGCASKNSTSIFSFLRFCAS